jgi:hypothetical protein
VSKYYNMESNKAWIEKFTYAPRFTLLASECFLTSLFPMLQDVTIIVPNNGTCTTEFPKMHFNIVSRGSSVSIMYGCGLDDRVIEVRSPA